MKLTSSRSLLLFVALVLPFTAEANTGTGLMFAKGLHVTYGNVVIGLLEGWILCKLSKYKCWKCIWLMIFANFFSTLLGVPLFHELELALPLGWNNARGLFWLFVFLAYLLTLLSEFPFVWLAFRSMQLSLKKAVRASLILQSSSYLLLIGWYGLVTPPPVKIVDPSTMQLSKEVTVYFIATSDGNVYSSSLHDRKWKCVFEFNEGKDYGLFSKKSPQLSGAWDLIACTDRWYDETSTNSTPILIEEQITTGDKPVRESYGIIPTLGTTNASWKIWHYVGRLSGHNVAKKLGFGFTMGTPFCSWHISDPILLPGDKILLQLWIGRDRAHDHICIYDLLADQLSVIARGRSPMAVLKKENSVDQPKPKE